MNDLLSIELNVRKLGKNAYGTEKNPYLKELWTLEALYSRGGGGNIAVKPEMVKKWLLH